MLRDMATAKAILKWMEKNSPERGSLEKDIRSGAFGPNADVVLISYHLSILVSGGYLSTEKAVEGVFYKLTWAGHDLI